MTTDFRITDTFTETTRFAGRPCILTVNVCEELIEGRWEGFVSIAAIQYLD